MGGCVYVYEIRIQAGAASTNGIHTLARACAQARVCLGRLIVSNWICINAAAAGSCVRERMRMLCYDCWRELKNIDCV